MSAEHLARFSAEAAQWPGGEYDINGYASTAEALDGYAAFHAHALRQPDGVGKPHKSLVFVPNQYGLGNRLRAMKAALLMAMLTGRVFHTRWEEPYPAEALLKPERIDWREPTPPLPRADPRAAADADAHIVCLPFATAPPGGWCALGMQNLRSGDLRRAYARVRSLEVHTFTDLNIYLATNPTYAGLLARLGTDCPKRMGCLYRYLFSPQPVVQAPLDALLASAGGTELVGVQVRNRLWRLEAINAQPPLRGAAAANGRVLECMGRYVPPDASVFFTADDDTFYAPAAVRWGARLIKHDGGVYAPWSAGGKVDASQLTEEAEVAVLKAIVDWFALQAASRIIYTHQSSFGKTAAESSSAPNVDVNFTACARAEAAWGGGGGTWAEEWAERVGAGITYDVSRVPGARGSTLV